MRSSLLMMLLFAVLLPRAQVVAPDTVPLTYERFLERVIDYHPRSQRASLLLEMADAEMRRSRGAFDPKLEGNLDQKVFKDQTYYRYLDGGIKMPTRLGGLTVKAGYEQASGININPESAVPGAGLVNAGIMMPLGQGLLIDQARADFRQARIGMDAAPVEQQARLNDLLFEAAYAYWDWAEAAGRVEILQRGLQLAQDRLDFIRRQSVAGDLAAIDTLKALIQVQNRRLDLRQAELELEQFRALLQVYLWQEGRIPWGDSYALLPEPPRSFSTQRPLSADSIANLMTGLEGNHPDLLSLRYKLASLDVERRWKAEKLKPKVNLEYAVLNEPVFTNGSTVDPRLFMDNYKWGLNLSFPIFLREARGDLGLTRIKIQDTQWKQQEKQQEIEAKIDFYTQQLDAIYQQMSLSEQNVQSYRRLLAGEQQKFVAGESSVFEINVWETQLIEAEIKLLSLQGKYAKTQAATAWAAGQLGLQ